MSPMRAAAEAYREVRPEVRVEWVTRSGNSFASQPLEEVTGGCDIISYDHPHVGAAAAARCLLPLDQLLPPETLADLEQDAIGLSHASYAWHGQQWGLATDAAAQVSVVRPDLLAPECWPRTWDEALSLAQINSGHVTTSLAGADALCTLLTLCASRGTPIEPAPDMRWMNSCTKASTTEEGTMPSADIAWETSLISSSSSMVQSFLASSPKLIRMIAAFSAPL
jgi:multiple sugar transport system substrate-binding protein